MLAKLGNSPYRTQTRHATVLASCNRHNPYQTDTHCKIIFNIIRLGLNITLTHQNRSYRDSETKENVETQKMKHAERGKRHE